MHIAEKCKLLSEILKSKDDQVLSAVKSLLKIENTEDFFEELNAEDLAAIDEALEQLENGEFTSHDSVRKEIKNRFNF
jgi:predicted transcriptional regulator